MLERVFELGTNQFVFETVKLSWHSNLIDSPSLSTKLKNVDKNCRFELFAGIGPEIFASIYIRDRNFYKKEQKKLKDQLV